MSRHRYDDDDDGYYDDDYADDGGAYAAPAPAPSGGDAYPDADLLDAHADMIRSVADKGQRKELEAEYKRLRAGLA